MRKWLLVPIFFCVALCAFFLFSCLETPVESNFEQHEHTFGDWVIEREPTCQKSGSRYCVCIGCSEVKWEQIPSHKWGEDDRCTLCHEHKPTEGLIFRFGWDSYEVSGYNGSAKEIYIPSYYQDAEVTCIMDAFQGRQDITEVTIPHTVTSIQSNAFRDCTSLKTVNLEEGLETITWGAFAGCAHLESITIPDSVRIMDGCFFDCIRLKSVVLSENTNITRLGSDVFKNCAKLTSFVIPETVTDIGYSAFEGCMGLRSVTLPAKLSAIGFRTFADCGNLSEIAFGNQIKRVISNAFLNCEKLRKVYFTGTISDWLDIEFEDGADTNPLAPRGGELYINGEVLTDLVIPNGVTKVGYVQFLGCSLHSVTIPASVKSLSYQALGCSFESGIPIYFEGSIAEWCEISGLRALPSRNIYINGARIPKDLVIPEGVTSIADSAFTNVSFSSVVLPASVKSVGSVAISSTEILYYGGDLESWCSIDFQSDIGLNHLYLNGEPFSGDVVIPDTVSAIPSYTFCASDITSITIPESVTEIRYQAFGECEKLTSVYYGGNIGQWSEITFQSEYSNPIALSHNLYIGGRLVTDIVLPEGVERIGQYAFSNYGLISSITLPESLTEIGDNAFYKCERLTTVTIPDQVSSIGGFAFYGCSDLYYVSIGRNVQKIEKWAFDYCDKIAEVYNRSALTIEVGSDDNGGVARNAKNVYTDRAEGKLFEEDGFVLYREGETLSVIAYVGTKRDIVLPQGVTEIDSRAFSEEQTILSITIPDSVVKIGTYAFNRAVNLRSVLFSAQSQLEKIEDGAFYGCIKLSSFVIPDSVTEIGSSAFLSCRSLGSLTIGKNVISLGYGVFFGCDVVKEVYNRSSLSKSELNLPYLFEYDYYTESFSSKLYVDQDGYVIYSPDEWEKTLVSYVGDGHDLILPSGITNIGRSAFEYADEITSVVIPEGVFWVGSYAFSGCQKLKSITFPNSLTSIGDGAFSDCVELPEIKLPDVYIASSAFSRCESLFSVSFGKNTRIGSRAFSKCTSLTKISVPSGCLIDYKAFEDCIALTSVELSEEIESVRGNAFSGCDSLIYNEYDNAYYLGNEMHPYLCLIRAKSTDVKSCEIHETTALIAGDAFEDCDELTSIFLPRSVRAVGLCAFRNCTLLSSLIVEEGNEWLYSKNNCILSKESPVLIAGCGTSVIPDDGSVETIAREAFSKCSSLTSITLPASIEYIDYEAFYGCTNLVTIYNYSSLKIEKGNWQDYGGIGLYAQTIYEGTV